MLHWIERTQEWILYAYPGVDSCSSFEIYGAYGSCNIIKHPPYSMEGFESKFPQEWESFDCSNGCQRKKRLDCESEYGFREVSGVKLPETRRSRHTTVNSHKKMSASGGMVVGVGLW
uniref:G-type lectin S-receptor-like serine/threonine-protein kinase At4g27290 n=1 Tax=Tanacetum cinerariifolium TaxID=118510 RepID=A0A699IEZ9_TANCI|nr:G-type lectin S-receptor-like serine/threonine-protein kinase At4g27290 [Tanacetum cinerariifolium]